MDAHPVVLFDGVCNFCNGTVNFLLRQDKNDRLRFAALQSEAGQQLLAQHQLPQTDFDTFILIENGTTYNRSTAALKLAQHLPLWWRWTQLFWLVPGPVRDGVYSFVARNRYKWFGKKEECMLPTPAMKNRFL